ncbi:MAG: GTP pyrophosphokinase [Chloroflexota bacterium]|jgi:(p)ppGpp synthase/HD superfamily hydrolase
MLNKAIQIAVQAHDGQYDKSGRAYILHPLQVMFQMSTDEDMIVAVLHDVVEDSDWTLDKLRGQGFSERILEALEALTKREDEAYSDFIDRAAANPIARRVKLADLHDNMRVTRLREITQKDLDRLVKYHDAWNRLSTQT